MKKFEVGRSYKCEHLQVDVGWVTSTATVIKRTTKTVTLEVSGTGRYDGVHKTYIDPNGKERAESFGFCLQA